MPSGHPWTMPGLRTPAHGTWMASINSSSYLSASSARSRANNNGLRLEGCLWDIQLVLQCEAGYEALVSLGKHGEGARIVLEPVWRRGRGAGVGVGRRFAPEARGLPLEHGGLLPMLTMREGGLLPRRGGCPGSMEVCS